MNRVLYLCFSVAWYHASCAGSEVFVVLRHCLSGETSLVSPSEKYVTYFCNVQFHTFKLYLNSEMCA